MSGRKGILACLLFLYILTACGSKRQTVYLPPDFKGPKELSRLYGVSITPDDNIFLYNAGAKWLGTPHRYGGTTRRGIDCSGLVSSLYKEVYDLSMARSSADILRENCRKIARKNLQEGDLVFFRTDKKRKHVPNHVGIYLKEGRFIHASTSRGVIVSRLNEPYYRQTWITGGRVK